jgi:uncharacterized protein YgiM (DUF1202 family)
MMRLPALGRSWLLLLLLLGLALACSLSGQEEPTTLPPPPVVSTPVQTYPAVLPATVTVEGAGQPSPAQTPTLAATVTIGSGVTAGPTVSVNTDVEYLITHVEENDILNVRSGPGVGNGVVTNLRPGTRSVRIVGFGQNVDDSLWVPINAGTVSGWVNSRFLTEQVDAALFCSDPEPRSLLDSLKSAVSQRNGQSLASLSDLSRGLRVRRYWNSEGVRFEDEQIANVFNSTSSYFWGVADGSGLDINGSFNDIILPLLDRDLLPATEFGCNEILHGGTAGLIQLPARYEGVNYFSLYRPPAAGSEQDWGTWVVGIERWQEDYFVSFLVHYQWQI